MKNFSFFILVFIQISYFATAQNVGIGNTNPAYTLDLSGRLRIRGGIDNDNAAGIWLNGSGAESLNLKSFIGHRNDTSVGIYGIGYDWMFNVDPRNGHLGMAGMRTQSNVELALSNLPGNKISLYQTVDNKFYGFGIAPAGLMQVLTPYSTNDVVFGTGSSDNFTENMRLTGSGNLIIGATAANQSGLTVNKRVGATNALFGSNTTGVAIESSFPGIGLNSYYNGSRRTIATGYSGYIGVNPLSGGMQLLVSTQYNNTDAQGIYKTAIDIKPDGKVGIGVNDPSFALDVAERMRIRSIPGYTAGLWFNNDANNSTPAFIGMYANDQVGFYGSGGANWGFTMNTQNGALSVNGNTGQAGQVLTSNNAAAPVWKGVGDIISTLQSTGQAGTNNSAAELPITNTDINFTVTQNTKVLIWYRTTTDVVCLFGPCPTSWRLKCYLNGNFVEKFEIYAQKSYQGLQSDVTVGPTFIEVPPGSHSLTFTAQRDWGLPTAYLKPFVMLLPH